MRYQEWYTFGQPEGVPDFGAVAQKLWALNEGQTNGAGSKIGFESDRTRRTRSMQSFIILLTTKQTTVAVNSCPMAIN